MAVHNMFEQVQQSWKERMLRQEQVRESQSEREMERELQRKALEGELQSDLVKKDLPPAAAGAVRETSDEGRTASEAGVAGVRSRMKKDEKRKSLLQRLRGKKDAAEEETARGDRGDAETAAAKEQDEAVTFDAADIDQNFELNFTQ